MQHAKAFAPIARCHTCFASCEVIGFKSLCLCGRHTGTTPTSYARATPGWLCACARVSPHACVRACVPL
eukprot:6198341-Pleurochrysis_carterae.AAC.3